MPQHQRIYFQYRDPATGNHVECFFDATKTNDAVTVEDWGMMENRHEKEQRSFVTPDGEWKSIVMEGGRKVQPAWLWEVIEKKKHTVRFAATEHGGKFNQYPQTKNETK